MKRPPMSRRAFVVSGTASIGALLTGPLLARTPRRRPRVVAEAVASGDVTTTSAVIWGRTNRSARLIVELEGGRSIDGGFANSDTDFTAKAVLTDLPPGRTIRYAVRFADMTAIGGLSAPLQGVLRTAPAGKERSVRFVWSADVAGQGWGIDTSRGGYRVFETMRARDPDFFVHCGDTIYADSPILPAVALADGTVWRNVVAEGVDKVAETLEQLRGRHRYNLLDANLRRFRAEVPTIAIWDDHEVVNNWVPGEVLSDPRYTERRVDVLAERGRQAFLEHHPIVPPESEPTRIYRSISYGPSLEVFALDMRSYRGPNALSGQTGDAAAFLGEAQLAWLSAGLRASKATWKVVAADMPLGLRVTDGRGAFDGLANGDGPPTGRELEMARLLRELKKSSVRNVVWVTGDVHYAAAHHYAPERARFADFDPFWEFVSGPAHAGTFGPEQLDDTFGPRVVFQKAPPPGQLNLPPSAGYQFFGDVEVDGATRRMTVTLRDVAGTALHTQVLEPAA